MSVDRSQAIAIAEAFLHDEVEPGVGQEVIVASVREFPLVWALGYNTRAFLETRSIRHALAGGGPLLIDKASGTLTVGTSARPVEDQVEGAEIPPSPEAPCA